MAKKKILILLSLAVFLFSASTASAAHYVSGYSSVDSGEIRWGGATTYATQWNAAISVWNALNKIKIAPDNIWTIEDLTVYDANRSDVAWVGVYTPYWWRSDTLYLNIYYLKNNSNAERQNTAAHELGHSLGLDHSFSGNILYKYQTPQTSLGVQDVSDYRYLWGY